MPDKSAFITFLIASCLLNLAPGPDMLYMMGRSIGQGRRAGVIFALGIFSGTLRAHHACGCGLDRNLTVLAAGI